MQGPGRKAQGGNSIEEKEERKEGRGERTEHLLIFRLKVKRSFIILSLFISVGKELYDHW